MNILKKICKKKFKQYKTIDEFEKIDFNFDKMILF